MAMSAYCTVPVRRPRPAARVAALAPAVPPSRAAWSGAICSGGWSHSPVMYSSPLAACTTKSLAAQAARGMVRPNGETDTTAWPGDQRVGGLAGPARPGPGPPG